MSAWLTEIINQGLSRSWVLNYSFNSAIPIHRGLNLFTRAISTSAVTWRMEQKTRRAMRTDKSWWVKVAYEMLKLYLFFPCSLKRGGMTPHLLQLVYSQRTEADIEMVHVTGMCPCRTSRGVTNQVSCEKLAVILSSIWNDSNLLYFGRMVN